MEYAQAPLAADRVAEESHSSSLEARLTARWGIASAWCQAGPVQRRFKTRVSLEGRLGRRLQGGAAQSEASALGVCWLSPPRPQASCSCDRNEILPSTEGNRPQKKIVFWPFLRHGATSQW